MQSVNSFVHSMHISTVQYSVCTHSTLHAGAEIVLFVHRSLEPDSRDGPVA